MEDGHPLPTVLVSSELKRQLKFNQDEDNEEDKRRKSKRRGIFQLEPGNTFFYTYFTLHRHILKIQYFRLPDLHAKIRSEGFEISRRWS